MKTVAKYLKPFIGVIIVVLVLQVARTYGELKLPNVMSDLVNIGIQYEGFEEKAPEIISEQGYKLITQFLPQNNDFSKAYSQNSDGNYCLSEHTKTVDNEYLLACYAAFDCYQTLSNDSDDFDLDKIYAYSEQFDQTDLTPFIENAEKLFSLSSVSGQISISFSKGFSKELGFDNYAIQMAYIKKEAWIMLGFMAFVLIVNCLLGFCVYKIGTGVVTSIRQDLFMRAMSFSNSEYDKLSVASIITRSTNDLNQVMSLIIMCFRLFLFAFMMAIGALVMAIRTSLKLSWIPGITVAILFAIIGILISIVLPKFQLLQKLVDRVNQLSRESLKGMLVIRAFRNEKHSEDIFDETNNNLRLTNRFTQRTLALMGPAMMLLMNGCSLLIIWIGGKEIAESALSVGSLMAYIQYATHIVMSFMMVASMFIVVPRAMVSINRIGEVLDTEPSVKDKENAIDFGRAEGKIEFKNVSFKFNNGTRNALNKITFTALPNQTTAIIGSTGSGKSTLVNLITRLYDSTDGEILIDGTNIKDITLKSLRNNIGFVPQKGMLFQGTFESNLRVGKIDASDEEIEKALTIAQAKEFVYASEKGLQTEVAQGGSSVSGGQRQRLSIARALIKNAPIYIFDDSFSALDLKTDAELRKALKENLHATLLIVAQRISTIMDADQIIVLDEGEIVGIGKHEYLMENCLTYREIAESQFNRGGED